MKIKTLRKIISAFAAVSVLTAASALVYAESEDPPPPVITNDPNGIQIHETPKQDVKVKNENKFDEVDYYVDIWWGSLEFEYTKGTWDPDTHKYIADEVLKPKNENDDIITISNHSNVPVKIGVSYKHYHQLTATAVGSQVKVSYGENEVTCSNYDGDSPQEGNELTFDLEAWGIGENQDQTPTAEVKVAPVVNDALVQYIENHDDLSPKWNIGTVCIRFEDPNAEPTEP